MCIHGLYGGANPIFGAVGVKTPGAAVIIELIGGADSLLSSNVVNRYTVVAGLARPGPGVCICWSVRFTCVANLNLTAEPGLICARWNSLAPKPADAFKEAVTSELTPGLTGGVMFSIQSVAPTPFG